MMEAVRTRALSSEEEIITDHVVSHRTFSAVFPHVLDKAYGDKPPHRPNEISYVTVADRLK